MKLGVGAENTSVPHPVKRETKRSAEILFLRKKATRMKIGQSLNSL
jgi:hypothetical protein